MQNLKMVQIGSSAIKAVGFKDNVLFVKFTDSPFYAYSGVSEETYQELLKSQSKGRFVNQNIKGQYQEERLDN